MYEMMHEDGSITTIKMNDNLFILHRSTNKFTDLEILLQKPDVVKARAQGEYWSYLDEKGRQVIDLKGGCNGN